MFGMLHDYDPFSRPTRSWGDCCVDETQPQMTPDELEEVVNKKYSFVWKEADAKREEDKIPVLFGTGNADVIGKPLKDFNLSLPSAVVIRSVSPVPVVAVLSHLSLSSSHCRFFSKSLLVQLSARFSLSCAAVLTEISAPLLYTPTGRRATVPSLEVLSSSADDSSDDSSYLQPPNYLSGLAAAVLLTLGWKDKTPSIPTKVFVSVVEPYGADGDSALVYSRDISKWLHAEVAADKAMLSRALKGLKSGNKQYMYA